MPTATTRGVVDHEQVRRLRAAGLSFEEVGVQLGVSKQRIEQLMRNIEPIDWARATLTLNDDGSVTLSGDVPQGVLASSLIAHLHRLGVSVYDAEGAQYKRKTREVSP